MNYPKALWHEIVAAWKSYRNTALLWEIFGPVAETEKHRKTYWIPHAIRQLIHAPATARCRALGGHCVTSTRNIMANECWLPLGYMVPWCQRCRAYVEWKPWDHEPQPEWPNQACTRCGSTKDKLRAYGSGPSTWSKPCEIEGLCERCMWNASRRGEDS